MIKNSITTKRNKERLLECLKRTRGLVSPALTMAGIVKSTYYKYMQNDPEFRELVWEIQDQTLDYVELKLFELIEKGDIKAIMFFLKSKGKNRGYGDNIQVDVNGKIENHNIEVIRLIGPKNDEINKIDE